MKTERAVFAAKTEKIVITVTLIVAFAVVASVLGVMYLENFKSAHPQFLTEAEWSRYDNTLNQAVNITFTDKGKYIYSSEYGQPIGNSDMYDRYSYYDRFNRIDLSGSDSKDFIVILYHDKHTLVLLFDDGVHIFKNMKDRMGDEVHELAREYIDENDSANLTVLGFEDGGLTVAPYNYDADSKEGFTEFITDISAADGIKFTSVTVTVEDGNSQIELYELDEKDYEYIGEYYTSGFLRFDYAGQVREVLFYGETAITN